METSGRVNAILDLIEKMLRMNSLSFKVMNIYIDIQQALYVGEMNDLKENSPNYQQNYYFDINILAS